MLWTFEDFQYWKQYTEQKGRHEIEEKLRMEIEPHGRQQLLSLIDELIKRMGFEEDMNVMKGRKPRTYAECCEDLMQCFGSMKTTERNNYNA